MRVWSGAFVRRLASRAAWLPVVAILAIGDAQAAEPVRVLLSGPLDALAAPLFEASARNQMRKDKLDIAVRPGKSSADTLARLAAHEADIALIDMNALIRYREQADAAPIKAIYALGSRSPYSIIARKSRGIAALADLSGKKIAASESDLADINWLHFAKINNLDLTKTKLEKISSAVREPLLSAGQVDAVIGLATQTAVNLKDRGVPASDLLVLNIAAHDYPLYGLVVAIDPQFSASNPERVRNFLAALTLGIKASVKNPARAVTAVLPQIENASKEPESERLDQFIAAAFNNEEVRQNGLGGINATRLQAQIDALPEPVKESGKESGKARKKMNPADLIDESFLPASPARMMN